MERRIDMDGSQEELQDEVRELKAKIDKKDVALRRCRDAIQGYKDTHKLHPESVLNIALVMAREALK